MPGVNVDGGERPLGALAAGVPPPPAMELHANKRECYVLHTSWWTFLTDMYSAFCDLEMLTFL